MTAMYTYSVVAAGTNNFYLKANANRTDLDLEYHGAVCMFFRSHY